MKWKTLALIFIVITILETTFIGYLFILGTELDNKETRCAYDICVDYPSYSFNQLTNICECYKDDKRTLWENMG